MAGAADRGAAVSPSRRARRLTTVMSVASVGVLLNVAPAFAGSSSSAATNPSVGSWLYPALAAVVIPLLVVAVAMVVMFRDRLRRRARLASPYLEVAAVVRTAPVALFAPEPVLTRAA